MTSVLCNSTSVYVLISKRPSKRVCDWFRKTKYCHCCVSHAVLNFTYFNIHKANTNSQHVFWGLGCYHVCVDRDNKMGKLSKLAQLSICRAPGLMFHSSSLTLAGNCHPAWLLFFFSLIIQIVISALQLLVGRLKESRVCWVAVGTDPSLWKTWGLHMRPCLLHGLEHEKPT